VAFCMGCVVWRSLLHMVLFFVVSTVCGYVYDMGAWVQECVGLVRCVQVGIGRDRVAF